MFEEECVGHEMPLADALRKIRSSSMRLSMVAKRTSTRRMSEAVNQKSTLDTSGFVTNAYQSLVSLITRSVLYLKNEIRSDNLILGVFTLLFFLGLCNLWTYRQLLATNQTLSQLDAHMKQLSIANQILLSKLDQSATCTK
jgi:hypothetical protein